MLKFPTSDITKLTVIAFLFVIPACTEPSPDVLRFGLASAPSNLDPRFATDATSARINRLLYERLVDFNQASQPVPSLATWETLTTTHYRFRLKNQNSQFHDGSPLTSRDVKTTYDFILDPQHNSPHRSLNMIDRIEAPREDTIDFHLTRPDPLFPGYLIIGILPARLVAKGHPFHSHPVGSGPFAFRGRPDENRLQLVRRSDSQPFEFIRVPDPMVRVLKLLAGEIDMMQNDLPPELVAYLAKNPQVHIQRGRGTNFAYLGFNLQDPLTGQLVVRQAVAHAIDREAIIRLVLGGSAHLAQSLLPPDHWAGDSSLQGYDYNPEKARNLLAKAGYSQEHPIHLTYKTSSDPFRIRLATIFQHQLTQVGFRVDLRSYDWGTFYGDIKVGRFQMYSLSWVGIKTPDIFSYVFHSRSVPPNGANRGRFKSPSADRLIEQAEAAEALVDKRAYYQQLQAHLLETLPYVPLWYEDHVFIARREIEGFTVALDGNYDGLKMVHRHITPLRH